MDNTKNLELLYIWKNKLGRIEIRQLVFGAAIIGVALGIFYSFITTPYTGDIQVFMAGVNQVKYQSSGGLLGLFEAWDMKGIVNRIIFYAVYRCTLLFVQYGDVYPFMVVSKAIYGIFALFIIVSAAYFLPTSKKNKLLYGFISYFAVFATFTASQLQAEMSAVLLCLLVFSLLMGESKWRMIIGGCIGSLFLFTKSILVLLFFSVISCVILAKNNNDLKNYGLHFIVFAYQKCCYLS